MCDLANRSIVLNKLENRFKIINEDIKNLDNVLEHKYYDAIVTNPPYKKTNSGIVNCCSDLAIARHEIMCTLEDIIRVSFQLLKTGGSFYMIHKAERLADIICTLRKFKLEPKVIKFQFTENEAKLVLIKAIKDAKDFCKIYK